jgi:photosystem II stability/assembly factor-like uncharacterized protein
MKKVLSLIVILVLGALNTQAQWEQSNGPYGGDVRSLIQSGNYLYAGTFGGGVFRSSDNGESWQEKSIGLNNRDVYSLIQSGNYIYAGTDGGGVYRSTDNGESWQEQRFE